MKLCRLLAQGVGSRGNASAMSCRHACENTCADACAVGVNKSFQA